MTPEGIDAVFSALSDPTRREVMRCISEGGVSSVSEIAEQLPVTRQAVAKHLDALDEAGLVSYRRAGREKRYTLTPAPLSEAMTWMADVGAEWDDRLQSLERHLKRGERPR
ncbi:MAG: winged helix-turn-helix transcriptional regulator [Actinobacteria bacterium]|nr:winged helix-turn-helix transcriptional regulator [Actinomycetota bacterium]